jgi:hypothetical protein
MTTKTLPAKPTYGAAVFLDTTGFVHNLSAADSDAQKAFQTLDALVAGAGDTYKMMVTAADTTPGYLASKLVVGAGTNSAGILELSTLTPAGNEQRKIQIDEAKIAHNNLSGYAADNHIAHSGVSIGTAADSGLSGGGTIASSRALSVDIHGTTLKDAPIGADEVLIYDSVAAALKRTTFSTFGTYLGLSGYALLAGRAGGQTLSGGTAASENLVLNSTSHGTKGLVALGTVTGLVYDEQNIRLGMGKAPTLGKMDFIWTGDDPGIVITMNGSLAGNARSKRSIDIQHDRTNAANVCGGSYGNTILGAHDCKIEQVDTYGAGIYSGYNNIIETSSGGWGTYSVMLGGSDNVCSNKRSLVNTGRYLILRGVNQTPGYNYIGGSDCWMVGKSYAFCHGSSLQVNHDYATAFGNGGLTSADADFIVGNGGGRNVNSVYFRTAGDTADVHIGRPVDGTAIAAQTNTLKLHTINASNQSKFIGHAASTTLTATGTYYWPTVPATNGAFPFCSTAGILSWSTKLFEASSKIGIGIATPATILEIEENTTLTGDVTDSYTGCVQLDPGYTVADAGNHTVTRHNYINVENPSETETSGTVTITDAAFARFDAAAGTHKAVDSASTKTTPGGVDAWLKINVNGVIHYIPAYTSKTA